jgi:hypothetical protein
MCETGIGKIDSFTKKIEDEDWRTASW